MKRWLNKQKKYTLPIAVLLAAALYLLFAYNYFFFRWHSTKLPWPNNEHTYIFNQKAQKHITYVALGDSLTFGFGANDYKDSYTYQVARFMAKDDQRVTLKDFSYPGYRVKDVLQTVDAAVAYKPDVITLFVGVNDTHKLVQSANFNEDYRQALARLSSQTDARIYVISLPYLGADNILLPPYSNYFDAKTRAANNTIRALARQYGAFYIDLYTPTQQLFKKPGPHYSPDRYHPSAEGYKIWAGIIENDIGK